MFRNKKQTIEHPRVGDGVYIPLFALGEDRSGGALSELVFSFLAWIWDSKTAMANRSAGVSFCSIHMQRAAQRTRYTTQPSIG